MKEVHSAGGREFVYSLLWSVFLLLIGRALINALPAYKVFGTVFTLLMFCVLAFFVLTRYSAVFTYEDTGTGLRVNRTIGKRNKEIEIPYGAFISLSSEEPAKTRGPRYNMRPSVFSKKRCTYIVFGIKGQEQTLVFEPGSEFIKALKLSIKNNKQRKG